MTLKSDESFLIEGSERGIDGLYHKVNASESKELLGVWYLTEGNNYVNIAIFSSGRFVIPRKRQSGSWSGSGNNIALEWNSGSKGTLTLQVDGSLLLQGPENNKSNGAYYRY